MKLATTTTNLTTNCRSWLLLTHNGEDYHHKVENVPCHGKEVTTQGKDLNEAFGGEDDNEDQVDLVEDGLHALGLFICLHHHGHHIDDNKHHDHDVEGLFGHQVEEEGLQNVLDPRKRKRLSTIMANICDL